MKRLFAISFLVFVVALAVVIGQRMSTDAMAVVIGVIVGVAASIPASLLIIVASRRVHSHPGTTPRPSQERYFPPVIVVNSDRQPSQWAPSMPGPEPLLPPERRQFRIVGDDGWTGAWDEQAIDVDDWRQG